MNECILETTNGSKFQIIEGGRLTLFDCGYVVRFMTMRRKEVLANAIEVQRENLSQSHSFQSLSFNLVKTEKLRSCTFQSESIFLEGIVPILMHSSRKC